MIIYDKKGTKIKCTKTKKPKMNENRNTWDSLLFTIDGKTISFYFRYTGNFFFIYKNEWYKTGYDNTNGQDISFDVFPRELFTHKPA